LSVKGGKPDPPPGPPPLKKGGGDLVVLILCLSLPFEALKNKYAIIIIKRTPPFFVRGWGEGRVSPLSNELKILNFVFYQTIYHDTYLRSRSCKARIH
jgi:hypothetical protein